MSDIATLLKEGSEFTIEDALKDPPRRVNFEYRRHTGTQFNLQSPEDVYLILHGLLAMYSHDRTIDNISLTQSDIIPKEEVISLDQLPDQGSETYIVVRDDSRTPLTGKKLVDVYNNFLRSLKLSGKIGYGKISVKTTSGDSFCKLENEAMFAQKSGVSYTIYPHSNHDNGILIVSFPKSNTVRSNDLYGKLNSLQDHRIENL